MLKAIHAQENKKSDPEKEKAVVARQQETKLAQATKEKSYHHPLTVKIRTRKALCIKTLRVR